MLGRWQIVLVAIATATGPALGQALRPVPPPDLPRYEIDLRLDPGARRVAATERLTFTNRSATPTAELVFHVYPRYRMPEADALLLNKTVEFLRLSPEEAIDAEGNRLTVGSVAVEGAPARYGFDPNDSTILVVTLPRPVGPGETIAAEIAFAIDLPDVWGRWGQHGDITYLVNWYPVLAHHDDRGWERTPFVPWHQPWHQEAGHYTVRADLPAGFEVASSGRVVGREAGPAAGRQILTIVASPARDFAMVTSPRFRVWQKKAGTVNVRVCAFPEHEANARKALDYACEVIPLYEGWFGPYPDDEFEIAASYFGWNGNECSGLVLLDDRILRLPAAGERYLDHLVTHETCHQWWWNVVGTNGYAETFMDEGLVNSFTATRLDAKYGRNASLITWPRGLGWLPTIGREDLRLSGYYGYKARGNRGASVNDLKSMGDLNTLFSLAYDRGGKVIGMIRNRLGDDRFWDFWRGIYARYAWRTFHYADLRSELIAFDPAGDWGRFLDRWLLDHAETDWAVARVRVEPVAGRDDGLRRVSVELEQRGEMVEPTVVQAEGTAGAIRVPIWPDRGDYEVPGGRVRRLEGRRWLVEVEAPEAPRQVEVDPDHALLDAVPDNNRWRRRMAVRATPFVTPIDAASQFQPFDRPSLVVGPFVDMYARGGLRATLQRLEKYQLTGWVGVEPALNEIIFGGQATKLHFPGPNWAVGFFYEEGLFNFYNDSRHSGGRAFLRKRLIETSSFLVDDTAFAEVYYGLGNEFWPGDDGRPVNAYLGAVGARYRINTQFPYWDPVRGWLLDVTGEYGNALVGSDLDYVRTNAEIAGVHALPEGWGLLSRSRIAARVYAGYGSPDRSPYFRLGGGRRLRALDLSRNLGASVWLVTLEWRMPIWRNIDADLLDHTTTFKNLFGTLFYDVGQSYLDGDWSPVVHGVGVGLRLDTVLFQFLERATLRLDIAQPVGAGPDRGPNVWFGLNQAF